MADTFASYDDGYYWVVSADETANALDSRGGLDQSGTDVWYYARNRSDAQLVSLRNVTQGGQAGFTLRFPLTGRYLDVSQGTYTAVTDGTRVQAWDGSGARNQVWRAVDSGGTATVDGAARKVVRLRSMALRASGDSRQYCLDGSGDSAAAGTVTWLWHEYSGGKQLWCLVPVRQPPLGVYTLRPATAPTLCLDVEYGSVQSGANVQIYTANDANSQKFVLSEGMAGDELLALAHVASGNWLDVDGGSASIADGRNVQVWAGNGSDAQQWAFVGAGQGKVNGVACDAFEVAPQAGTNFRLDSAGGGKASGSNAQVWTRTGKDSQRWLMLPDEATATDVSAPASVCLTSGGKALGKAAGARGALKLYPRWTCAGTMWKVRYRTRERTPGGAWGSWGAWKGLRLGSSANSGWDDMWRPSETSEAGGTVTSSQAIAATVDNAARDGLDVEVEVRRFLDSWGPMGRECCAHTASGAGRVTLTWQPKVTLTAAAFSPSGLAISYETDSKRDGHSLTLTSALFGTAKADKTGRSGTVTVPVSQLAHVPADGEQVKVSATLTSCDGARSAASATVKVAYDAGHGMELAPKYTRDAARSCWSCACEGATGCWVVAPHPLGGERFLECWQEGGRWVVPAPLGSRAHVFLAGRSADGSKWATRDDWLDALPDRAHVWAWEGGAARVEVGGDSGMTVAHALTADSEEAVTTGRDLPVVRFGRTVTAACDVSGVAAGTQAEVTESLDALRALVAAGRDGARVVYRDPYGFCAEVAVTAASVPRSRPGWAEVTVTQEAVG